MSTSNVQTIHSGLQTTQSIGVVTLQPAAHNAGEVVLVVGNLVITRSDIRDFVDQQIRPVWGRAVGNVSAIARLFTSFYGRTWNTTVRLSLHARHRLFVEITRQLCTLGICSRAALETLRRITRGRMHQIAHATRRAAHASSRIIQAAGRGTRTLVRNGIDALITAARVGRVTMERVLGLLLRSFRTAVHSIRSGGESFMMRLRDAITSLPENSHDLITSTSSNMAHWIEAFGESTANSIQATLQTIGRTTTDAALGLARAYTAISRVIGQLPEQTQTALRNGARVAAELGRDAWDAWGVYITRLYEYLTGVVRFPIEIGRDIPRNGVRISNRNGAPSTRVYDIANRLRDLVEQSAMFGTPGTITERGDTLHIQMRSSHHGLVNVTVNLSSGMSETDHQLIAEAIYFVQRVIAIVSFPDNAPVTIVRQNNALIVNFPPATVRVNNVNSYVNVNETVYGHGPLIHLPIGPDGVISRLGFIENGAGVMILDPAQSTQFTAETVSRVVHGSMVYQIHDLLIHPR